MTYFGRCRFAPRPIQVVDSACKANIVEHDPVLVLPVANPILPVCAVLKQMYVSRLDCSRNPVIVQAEVTGHFAAHWLGTPQIGCLPCMGAARRTKRCLCHGLPPHTEHTPRMSLLPSALSSLKTDKAGRALQVGDYTLARRHMYGSNSLKLGFLWEDTALLFLIMQLMEKLKQAILADDPRTLKLRLRERDQVKASIRLKASRVLRSRDNDHQTDTDVLKREVKPPSRPLASKPLAQNISDPVLL